MHIFPPLCGLLCSFLLPSCYRWHPSLLTLYIKLISRSLFLTVLVHFVLCFTVSQYHGRHIIINVSRSKCEYFVFSVFDMELCTFHEMYIVDLMRRMDGMYSLLCKTMSVSSSERGVYLLCVPFEQLVQHVFWKQRYFSTRQNSCSSLYKYVV